ncbi:hypothetical protein SBOR_3603 [Sclerotinia borealis F-4128]|uniref:Uncharacterized protein n=1 Tax=Sclerotinia borealis (strain F-4128) TaxID=1432307 RepID=W9CNE0_SCLBF|nr:hypothetical protein SBOR_3603 [Sclerotinia borealis F-4128]
MTEATNTKMMDTERGGENTQYESQNIFTQSPAKDQGTLGGISYFSISPINYSLSLSSLSPNTRVNQTHPLIKVDSTGPTEATLQSAAKHKARGEKTAENIRYGEAISEHGFGGETVGNEGGVGLGSESGDGKGEGGKESEVDVRRKMGYAGGSGVGG